MQTTAQIYLGTNRGRFESEGIRRLYTFNFGLYEAPERHPFGKLLACNEEVLAPGKRLSIDTKRPTEIVIMPLVGGVELMDGVGESVFIASGEAFNLLSFPESTFTLINPYSNETVSFLTIYLQPVFSGLSVESDDQDALTTFSLEKTNCMHSAFVASSLTSGGLVGRYEGRQEGHYIVDNPETGIFVFVIDGAFEVANRLLEKGDALALQQIDTVEFEALSNNAVLLLMEVLM